MLIITHDMKLIYFANMVDSAPNALNTLKELAAALADDANYATTIQNQLATKSNAPDVYTRLYMHNLILFIM